MKYIKYVMYADVVESTVVVETWIKIPCDKNIINSGDGLRLLWKLIVKYNISGD